MSLEDKARKILADLDGATSDDVLGILNQIVPLFKSNLTSEYLRTKMQKILDAKDESERKKQCNSLRPYLDWYLQGL